MAVKKTGSRVARKGGTVSARDQRKMLCENLSFSAAEAYKLLRTNLLFTLPATEGSHGRIIGVTSSIRGEGKSTTAVNLSYTLAETGKKVLLIDADMRLPSVAQKLGIKQTPGLSNLLAGLCTVTGAVKASSQFPNWQILPAGDIPPNPSELLGAEVMRSVLEKLSTHYDYILVDLPPVNIVSDALAVSQWIDGMIVVVRQNYTDRQALSFCMSQLSVLGSKLLGAVMTNASETTKENRKYGKYRKYGYGYGYGEKSGGAADGGKSDAGKTAKAGEKTARTGEKSAKPSGDSAGV